MDLQAFIANYQPTDLGYPGQRVQPQKKKKNFFVDQISTAGGILGGIAGTAIAPVAGTFGGAAAGSGLGEAIENMITGESITKNVGKEAALGGVFGAGPLKLLKGGAALAGGKGLQAASKAALTPLRAKAGQALTGAADDLAIKQFRLTPTQLKNFNQKFGEDAGKVIRKYGFQNADDIAVKGIEPLQRQFDEAIGAIPGVNKLDLQKNLTTRISKLATSGPSDTKALAGQLKKETDSILGGFGDVIDPKELNVIRRQFDDLVNYTEKISNPSRYGVNKRMADGIRETLQKADPTGSLKLVGRELQKLRQLSDVAAKQSQLGRGSLPLGLSTLLGGNIGGAAGGPVGAVGTALGTAAVNSPAGRRLAMTGTEQLGNKLTSAGAAAAGQSARGIGTRLGASGILRGLSPEVPDQSLENSAIDPMTMPNSMNPMNANMMGQLSPQGGQMSTQESMYTFENAFADMTRDPENADYYASLYEFANPKGEEQKPMGAVQQQRATAAANALGDLPQIEEAIQSGKLGGLKALPGSGTAIGSRLLGTEDLDAALFNIADNILRARSGAATPPDEVKRFVSNFLPRPTDSPTAKKAKIDRARRELEGYLNPIGGAGATLEDALMQYAQ